MAFARSATEFVLLLCRTGALVPGTNGAMVAVILNPGTVIFQPRIACLVLAEVHDIVVAAPSFEEFHLMLRIVRASVCDRRAFESGVLAVDISCEPVGHRSNYRVPQVLL